MRGGRGVPVGEAGTKRPPLTVFHDQEMTDASNHTTPDAQVICAYLGRIPGRGPFSRVQDREAREGRALVAGGGSAPVVLGTDHAAQAFAGGAEFVLEVPDLVSRGVGFGGARVAFGDETAVDGLEFGEAGDELGSHGPVDLGAELESKALSELVPLDS